MNTNVKLKYMAKCVCQSVNQCTSTHEYCQ